MFNFRNNLTNVLILTCLPKENLLWNCVFIFMNFVYIYSVSVKAQFKHIFK